MLRRDRWQPNRLHGPPLTDNTVPSWHLPLPSRFFSLLASSYSAAVGTTVVPRRRRHADLVFSPFLFLTLYPQHSPLFHQEAFPLPSTIFTNWWDFNSQTTFFAGGSHASEFVALASRLQMSRWSRRVSSMKRGDETRILIVDGRQEIERVARCSVRALRQRFEATSRWRPIQIRSPRGGDGVVLATATGTTPGAGQCVAILRPPAKSVLVNPPPRWNYTRRFRASLSFFLSLCLTLSLSLSFFPFLFAFLLFPSIFFRPFFHVFVPPVFHREGTTRNQELADIESMVSMLFVGPAVRVCLVSFRWEMCTLITKGIGVEARLMIIFIAMGFK